MANIRVDVDHPIVDGESITFKAPCDCSAITGIKVYYPVITDNAESITSTVFTMKDSHGNTLSGVGNLFSAGAYVKVVLNTTGAVAHLQNADTNKYLEDNFSQLRNRIIYSEDEPTGTIGTIWLKPAD